MITSSEIETSQSLVKLGKAMLDFMLLKYVDEQPPKTRSFAAQYLRKQCQAITQQRIDINKITPNPKIEVNNLNPEAISGYLELGKLTYNYLFSIPGTGVQYADICNYALQACSTNETKGDATKKSLQAMLFPIKNVVELIVLLGNRGVKIVNAANAIPKHSKTIFEFWRSQATIDSEHQDLKKNYILREIEPLCLLIGQAEMTKITGLDREKFNSYLKEHLSQVHVEAASRKGLSFIDYFDTEYPDTEKHPLRDDFINTILSEEIQESYFMGKNLLALSRHEMSFERFLRQSNLNHISLKSV